MIFYVTKQTFERYKLKMPEDLSFPMNEIAKATLKKESGNRLLEWGGKLFYFDKRNCIQFVNFASKLTIFVFDIKMDDLPMVGNYIANYLLDIYSNDKTVISRRKIIRTSVLKVKRKFILCQNARQYSKYWLCFFLV